MYEYAATIIAPTYFELKSWATNIEGGPSAAPITATDAASAISKPMNLARLSVKNIPNWAAAPKSSIFGFESSGPKSIIAPIPMKSNSGNSSFAIPALNKTSIGPTSVPVS